MHRFGCLFLIVFSLSVKSYAGPDVQTWIQAVAGERDLVSKVEPAKRDETAKKRLFQLGKKFPILTDWVLQDASPFGYKILISDASAELENQLLKKLGATQSPDQSAERLALYAEHCQARREARLGQVIEKWSPFIFTESHSVVNTFIGYTEGLSDARNERFFKPGAKLTVLNFKEGSTYGSPDHLIDDPNGMLRDVDVSYDKKRALFAWKKSDRLDDYHIYEYDLKARKERQLTRGLGRADYEPIYLPDGDIIFASTRPEQSVPCWWTEISNLYRMNPDGHYVRRLAIDQVHTLYPQVLNDGRISYTRWDYSDRGQNFPHPVFAMDPDGQAQRVYYGGNSWFPTSLLHTRAIPESSKVMTIAAGHHTRQHGKLLVLDVKQGQDEGKGMHFVSPERKVDYERVDIAQQHGDQFRYPFPLSETELLVSYIPDWGYTPDLEAHQVDKARPWTRHYDLNDYSLYWMNTAGEREYLYGDDVLGVQRPVALGHRAQQPVIKDTVDYAKSTGTLYIHDVYKGVGLKGIARGEAKKLRVVKLNYRAAGVGHNGNKGEGGISMNSTPVAVGNGTWDVKEIIGDADIHADGSALFEVPADESIYLQVLNSRGHVIQTTRSWDTVRPGEQKSCVGCHDKGNANYHPFQKEETEAWKIGIQKLAPFYGETRGFSFPKEIQPILDQKCITCHDGSKKDLMDLRGTPLKDAAKNKRQWSQSYINLTDAKRDKLGDYTAHDPEGGLVTWISKMSRPTELPPYFSGAAKSPLIKMLTDGHHEVKLTEKEQHQLAAWMDLLVPFSGTYREGHHWNTGEMKFYDYFEGKRTQQKKEEQHNIIQYLNSLKNESVAPSAKEKPAAFTRAVYQAVWQAESTQLVKGQPFKLDTKEPFRFDRLTLNVTTTQPVTIHLKRGEEVIDTIVVETGSHPVLWQSALRTISNHGFSLTSDHDILLNSAQAIGMRESDMPEVNGYKRHLQH